MPWSERVGEADWIVGQVHPLGTDVGSVVPPSFEAYVRIVHAVVDDNPEERRRGSLGVDELQVLIDILGHHTRRRDRCWFAVWDGFGWLQGPPAMGWIGDGGVDLPSVNTDARVRLPGRTMALFAGPITDAATFVRFPMWQSPNLWWPDDRAWCVASEIDLDSTYIGGSEALTTQLLNNHTLAAFPASVGDQIGAAAS